MKEPTPNLLKAIAALLDYYKPLSGQESENPSEAQAAYQKEFPGRAKAERVIEFASQDSSLDLSRVVYVSVGGGDGEEIEHALTPPSPMQKGVLLEYMDWPADRAKIRARHLALSGRELVVITGDAAQKLEDCRQHLLRWRNDSSSPATGLLISAQAVLHELPDRADSKQFDFKKIFALFDGFQTAIFHSREPTRPGSDTGWREPVELRLPHVQGTELTSAATLIQRQFRDRFSREAAQEFGSSIFAVADDWVQMPGLVAIELLHKLVRFSSKTQLRHEMEECLVALDPYSLQEKLGRAIGDIRFTRIEPTVTGSFHKLYIEQGVEARNAESGRALPVPLAFSFITAFKQDRHIGSSSTPASIPPLSPPSVGPRKPVLQEVNTASAQTAATLVSRSVAIASILSDEQWRVLEAVLIRVELDRILLLHRLGIDPSYCDFRNTPSYADFVERAILEYGKLMVFATALTERRRQLKQLCENVIRRLSPDDGQRLEIEAIRSSLG